MCSSDLRLRDEAPATPASKSATTQEGLVTVTRSFSVLTLALLTLLFAQRAGAADPEFKAWLGSAFTIPGEHSELWLAVVSGTRPDGIPLEPRAANLTFKLLGDRSE